MIVEYANALGLPTKNKTIPALCKLIEEATKGDGREFNKLVSQSRVAAPVMPQAEVLRISHQVEKDKEKEKIKAKAAKGAKRVPKPISEASQRRESSSLRQLIASPFTNRLKFAEYVQQIAKQHHHSICDFRTGFTIIKRIGSHSIHGEAYLVNGEYKGKSLYIAVKMMPDIRDNKKELQLYTAFNKYIVNHKNPHFPYIYSYKTCPSCPYRGMELQKLQDLKKVECIIAFNELANGDLESWMKQTHTDTEFASMWAQIVMSGFGLELKGLVHDDLHWGNILYHQVPTFASKYTHYTIGRDHIYIKNTGQHWVLWDFGMMYKSKSKKSVNVDMYRISSMWRWKDEDVKAGKGSPMPHAQSMLCYQISQLVLFSPDVSSYLVLLNKLVGLLRTLDPSVLLINPIKSPSPQEIINGRPYEVM